ncbi:MULTISPECIES: Crp/Fnr family transcriptional regulator [Nostocales]|uniref:Crp/Fnr family transcriptional regulator n=3 Tax=Nostocales TaxID=1161 RepID=A0A0C1R604_9CYAN|nr:Crp/Fnr family transcriptional regulator [Tolypothrix bouteillei]KAF3888092.1 Crp/Fnr family transcriptional regulator [Tolypothrix bouteillei VB521301]
MYEKMFQSLDRLVVLSEQQREDLKRVTTPQELPKDSILLEQGHICNHLHFLVEGAVRYYYHQDDKEITSGFRFEGDFINSFYSFISRKPSKESIILMLDCKLVTISYDSLQYLYNKDSVWNRLGRLSIESYYIQLEEHFFSLQSQTASERYAHLLQQYPDILNRVKLGHLASYLGVTQETLSRIRAKHRNRQRLRN